MTTYTVPDTAPNPHSGLTVWPFLADGVEIGCITEWSDGYQPRIFHREHLVRPSVCEPVLYEGPHFCYRDTAITVATEMAKVLRPDA